MKEPRMTLEEHREVGKELKRIRAFLLTTAADLTNKYGTSMVVAKRATQAHKAIDALQSALDEILFQEQREQLGSHGGDLIEVYYPAEEKRTRTAADEVDSES